MPVLKNIGYLATCRDEGKQQDIHPVREAAIVWQKDTIEWVGPEAELPSRYTGTETLDAGGRMVIPGLVDCHTHLVFGGWRPDEFVLRLQGKKYLEIAQSGGGILSTVRATRKATEQELFEKASRFLEAMAALGITTVECKSGYGLSLEEELKILRVYRRLAEEQPLHIVSTFLGAHTIPPEYEGKRGQYVDLVIREMIPAVANADLADFCDVFTEESAFTIGESRQILTAAKGAGLVPKLHADQLSPGRGAELAAELGAASADHLEKISGAGVEAMARAGVVAVMLPLASLYTQVRPLNGRKLADRGIDVAVATDFNPGSAPSYDLPLAMMLACNRGQLTPAEALKGATICAAKALRRDDSLGSIEKGKIADFAVVDAPDPDFWIYHFRPDQCDMTICSGEILH
ncbi:imidazolonepropionase [Fodinibius sediminis]|uniref:Imidazolonepropionase n=1 Tax=Fodinibius sediminis TaxID=1214077 RepID=A0A521AQG7_9BACT|nr:imidazolonepropionase [Fodinibius sediminis]SMO37001.1 imidazolonepropionase [Fodinibius sediminis]